MSATRSLLPGAPRWVAFAAVLVLVAVTSVAAFLTRHRTAIAELMVLFAVLGLLWLALVMATPIGGRP